MRRYDDPVEVRKGPEESPEQFLWRGKLWKVRAVLAHWVETGSWWQSADARAALGTDDTTTLVEEGAPAPVTRPGDLLGSVSSGASRPATTATAGSSTCPSTGPTAPGSSSAVWTEVIAP